MNVSLFRPVGLHELALMWDKGMREFPSRLPHQPIFYPVLTQDYARQIARDWNTRDEKPGFAGYVTAFSVDGNYLSKFEQHKVGSSGHVEFWIPAEDLISFNTAIRGLVSVQTGYFGPKFVGYFTESESGDKKDAVAQFLSLAEVYGEGKTKLTSENSFDSKCIFLNWLFWGATDFSKHGIDRVGRDALLETLRQQWKSARIKAPLPQSPDR
jgi:hypothetical protein